MILISRLFLALTLVLILAPVLCAETVSRVAAVAEDRIVTTWQLEQKVKEFLQEKNLPEPTGERLAALRARLLDSLIEDSLVQQRIEELGLKVVDAEVEAAIRDVQRQNKITREQLTAALEAQGMDFETYRENLRKQILQFRLIAREVRSKVDVTTAEIREYFKEHLDDYRQKPNVTLSHLSFPIVDVNEEADRALRARVNAALYRLKAGEDFDSVLADYEDIGALGGSMGTLMEEELVPVFVEAIESVEVGDYSAIVESNKALHILRVDARVPGSIRQFDDVKAEISNVLLEEKSKERFEQWKKSLREEAEIEIRI